MGDLVTDASPAAADERNRQRRGDDRRRQILDAAVELFAADGYRGTGVAALAERVGMTAPGMMYYFGTKERLLREVVAERDRAELDAVGDGALTLDSLRTIGRHNVERAALTRLYVVLGAENLDPDDPLHDFFVDRYAAGRSLIADVLAAERDRGTVAATVDVDAIAREILAVIMGLEIQWLMDPATVDLAAAVDDYIDRLIPTLTEEHP